MNAVEKIILGEIKAPINAELSKGEVKNYISVLVKAFEVSISTSYSKNQHSNIDKILGKKLEILLLSEYLKEHRCRFFCYRFIAITYY